MSSSERIPEFESETELIEDYRRHMMNPANLQAATDYLYESLVEEAVLGLCFQSHFESKHPEVFGPTDDSKKHNQHSDFSSNNKFLNCKCMNCEKTISVSKYASHLENCMGLGRNSSRIASRKKTTYDYDLPDDYDDHQESDQNWTAKEKTKKKFGNGRNGKNKNKSYM